MENRNLVDNNALNALRHDQIESKFFRGFCGVTDDVLWEAREHPDLRTFKVNPIPITPLHLEHVRGVMQTEKIGDTGLVDLYKNNGSADPGLIAAILDATTDDAETLFSDHWVLVTSDAAVARKAKVFNIEVIGPMEFAQQIEFFPSNAKGPALLQPNVGLRPERQRKPCLEM